jgi:hypothetical protein
MAAEGVENRNSQFIIGTFKCEPHNNTEEKCKKQFFKDRRDLQYIDVDPDGNCLFRSIAKYYENSGELLPGIANPSDYNVLRQYIAEQFGAYIRMRPALFDEIIDQDLHFRQERRDKLYKDRVAAALLQYQEGITNEYVPPRRLKKAVERSIDTILDELLNTGVWNVPAFDMMLELVPTLLHITLHTYSLLEGIDSYVISIYNAQPENGPSNTTISVFLSGGHYGLIYPKNNSNSNSNSNQYNSNNENENENENMRRAMAASVKNERNRIEAKRKRNNNTRKALAASAQSAPTSMVASMVNVPPQTRKKPPVAVRKPPVAPAVAPAVASAKSVGKPPVAVGKPPVAVGKPPVAKNIKAQLKEAEDEVARMEAELAKMEANYKFLGLRK